MDYVSDTLRMDEVAEDIVQDAFLHLLLLDRYDSVRNAIAYLYQSVRNLSIDRKRKHTEERMPQYAPSEEDETWLHDISELLADDSTNSPDQLLEQKELRVAINKAIAELTEEQRFVFVQTEQEGKSFQQLAEETGIPLNTLLSRKHYAVKSLRKQLANEYQLYTK